MVRDYQPSDLEHILKMDPDTGEAEYQMVWKKADGKED